MSRVTLSFLAAVMSFAAAGTAHAQCCNSGFAVGYGYAGSGCCNSGYAVQAAPVVVQQPVIVQPVVIQPQPIVQQYVVNQGPWYAGPGLTDYGPAIWYAPRTVGAFPYVGDHRWGYGYRRAYYGPRPAYHRPYHPRHHGPISVYN
jgi:hypothetical protein